MQIKNNSLAHGIHCFVAGCELIRLPRIRRFVIFPLILNTVLFSFGSWLLWNYLSSTVDSLLPSWLAWLAWLIVPVFIMIAVSIVYFGFTLLSNVIAAPFYGQLAKEVEMYLNSDASEQSANGSFMADMLPMIGSELRKLGYYLVRAVPLLILSLIPGVNVITLPIWVVFSAWFLTFEYSGYGLENHNVLFKQQKKIINQSQMSCMAFGACSLLATSIPIVNLLVPAVSVAGATKLLLERDGVDTE